MELKRMRVKTTMSPMEKMMSIGTPCGVVAILRMTNARAAEEMDLRKKSCLRQMRQIRRKRRKR